MTRLTRDKIGKLLDNQAIGNFSSLASLSKKNNLSLNNKLSLAGNELKEKNVKKYFKQRKEELVLKAKKSQKFTKKDDVKNPHTNIGSLDTDNIGISYSENRLVENVVKETTEPNFSVSNPLAIVDCEEISNIVLQETIHQDIKVEIKENNTAIFEDIIDYTKPDLKSTYNIFNENIKQNEQNFSVSGPLANYSALTDPEYNRASFNISDTLAGKGLTLVMHLIDLCQQNCSLVTPPVFTKDLLQVVCIKPTHLRNLILRLSEKKIFKVLLHKSSKHAIRIFEFEKNTYTSLTKRKCNIEGSNGLIENRSHVDLLHVKDKDHEQSKKLEQPLKNIDLSSLENIGFNETHLIQIYKEYEKNPNKTLSAEILQHSIDAFAFDLKYNHITESFKSSPAVVLLSLLKKGIPYSSRTPDKFLTPQEEALQHYLSNKQQKIKAQEEQENQLKEVEFIEWQNELTEQQITSIIGDRANGLVGSKIMRERSIKAWLIQHFDSEIWPAKRKQIIEQIQTSCKVD